MIAPMTMTRIDIALTVAVLLQLADFASTWRAIRWRGGREINPVVRWLMSRLGFAAGLTLAKVIGALLALWFWHDGAETELWVFSALYALVVVNNLRVRRRPRNTGS